MSVTLTLENNVAILRLDRPEKLNAINYDLLKALNARLDEALALDEAHVLLLAANGRAFSAGDDLAEFAQAQGADFTQGFVQALQDVTRKLMLGGKLVVCAAQGWIVGGAVGWLLNADVVVADEEARLFCPEAQYGLFPSGGATILLAERCGPLRAADILLLGERISARQMQQLGLVSRLTSADDLPNAAMKIAKTLAALPSESRQRYKVARQRDLADRLEQALQYEAQCCLEAGSPEAKAAIIDRAANLKPSAGNWGDKPTFNPKTAVS